MEKFPIKLLEPEVAILSGSTCDVNIKVIIRPFYFDDKLLYTSIRLDGISLPSLLLSDLAGCTFDFPINPTNGYIDGSIYLNSLHQPVDVTSISFHAGRNKNATVVIKGIMTFHEQYETTPFTFGIEVASTQF